MVLAELQGLHWELRRGSKHWQIRIEGHLVAILPHDLGESYGDTRATLATRSNIRRWKHQGASA